MQDLELCLQFWVPLVLGVGLGLRGLEFRVSGIGSYPKPESTLELRVYGSFPKQGELQYRPQNVLIGTPKMVPLVLGNPHIDFDEAFQRSGLTSWELP